MGGDRQDSTRRTSSEQRNLVKVSSFARKTLSPPVCVVSVCVWLLFDFFPAAAAGRRKVNRRLMDLTHGSKEATALGREMDMLSGYAHPHTHTPENRTWGECHEIGWKTLFCLFPGQVNCVYAKIHNNFGMLGFKS